MLGPKQVAQAALFFEFSIEDYVPQNHLLRSIDRIVDLSGTREHLAPFYSNTSRPSIDPDPLIRMLFVRYCLGTGPALCWVGSLIAASPRMFPSSTRQAAQMGLGRGPTLNGMHVTNRTSAPKGRH